MLCCECNYISHYLLNCWRQQPKQSQRPFHYVCKMKTYLKKMYLSHAPKHEHNTLWFLRSQLLVIEKKRLLERDRRYIDTMLHFKVDDVFFRRNNFIIIFINQLHSILDIVKLILAALSGIGLLSYSFTMANDHHYKCIIYTDILYVYMCMSLLTLQCEDQICSHKDKSTIFFVPIKKLLTVWSHFRRFWLLNITDRLKISQNKYQGTEVTVGLLTCKFSYTLFTFFKHLLMLCTEKQTSRNRFNGPIV